MTSSAAITLDPGRSTIVYPVAGRDSFSDLWIPGNGTNVKMRLGSESLIAMLGSVDAAISRLIFPTLGNYGGARNAQFEQLRKANWNEVFNGNIYTIMRNSTGWPYCLMNFSVKDEIGDEVLNYGYDFNVPSFRDFTMMGRRIEKVNSLLDRYVLGDIHDEDAQYDSIFYGGFCSDGFWLVPRGVKNCGDEMPEREWTEKFSEFNPFKDGYLLTLGEISKRGLKGEWGAAMMGHTPYNFYLNFFHSEFYGFCDKLLGSPNWGSVDPSKIVYAILGDPYMAGETNESIRAEKVIGIAEVLAAHADGFDFTVFTNRPTKRIWKDRIAFANAYLAACRTQMFPLPSIDSIAISVDDCNLMNLGSVWRSPYHRFKREQYNANQSAKLEMVMQLGEGETFGVNSDDGMIPLDLKSFKTQSYDATNDYSSVTNFAQYLTCAWIEDDAKVIVNGEVYQPVKFSAFGVQAYEILSKHKVGEWVTISLGYEVSPNNPYRVGLIVLDGGYQIGTGVGPEVSSNWNGKITITYDGRVHGVEGIEVAENIEPFSYGKETQEELNSLSLEKTIMPPRLHPISEALIDNIKLNCVDILGVATNRDDVGGVASGSSWIPGWCYDTGDPAQPDIFHPKDTWIYLRTKKIDQKLATKLEMDGYMFAMYDEAIGQMPSAFGMTAGLGDVYPPGKKASEMTEDVLKNLVQRLVDGEGGIKMQPQKPTILSPNIQVRATGEDEIEVAGGEDQIVANFSFPILFSRSTTPDVPLRASCAAGFWRQPHAIVNWKFPAMGHS